MYQFVSLLGRACHWVASHSLLSVLSQRVVPCAWDHLGVDSGEAVTSGRTASNRSGRMPSRFDRSIPVSSASWIGRPVWSFVIRNLPGSDRAADRHRSIGWLEVVDMHSSHEIDAYLVRAFPYPGKRSSVRLRSRSDHELIGGPIVPRLVHLRTIRETYRPSHWCRFGPRRSAGQWRWGNRPEGSPTRQSFQSGPNRSRTIGLTRGEPKYHQDD